LSELKQRLQRLTPAARRLLAQKLGSAASGAVHRPGVVDVFREWARRTPDAVAVADGSRSLSYAELDRCADVLAGRMCAAGAGAGVPVAFCLERSIESVLTMLAALKAGAAYVPLDPAHPPARLDFVLRDTGAGVLVANGGFRAAGLEYSGAVLTLDRADADAASAGPGVSLPAPVGGAQSPAYVMYTSGSTGQPKGVCIEQGGITRLVRGTNYIEFRPADRVAHASNPAFDAATFEVWGALLNGARLEILSAQDALSAHALGEEIRRRQLSVLFLTTALFNELALQAPAMFATLRCLVFGGEAASLAAVRAVVERGKPAQLINGYGPTENTTFTTTYEVGDEILAAHWRSVPIGRAIRGSYVRVLDAAMRPVRPGESGELYTGGEGLAREYLNRPELNRQAFVDDPMGAKGARLYRTGDLVVLREDGELEFVGRSDDQLKIRGFRIEPAEVQAAIEECPGVGRAVVLLRSGPAGGGSLLACVQQAAGAAPGFDALRDALRARLPAFMVPAEWMRVDEWPLTSNGKIDRAALLQRAGDERPSGPTVTAGSAAARDTEHVLLALVSELLGGQPVRGGDDFFELGGHSLLATRVAYRFERQTGLRLPVREIFDYPVLGDLARRIDSVRQAQPEVGEIAGALDASVGDCSDAPLSPMQQRLWFIEQLEPGLPLYHIHQVLRLRGALDVAALERALDMIVARHAALRTCIVRSGEAMVQRVRAHEPVSLPQVDLGEVPAANVEEVLSKRYDALFTPAFDFATGPLYRAELIRIDAGEHVLSWVMHHIVSDGWSMNVIREEFAHVYGCLVHGESPALPALDFQYADYARGCAEDGRLGAQAQQLAYWRAALAGMPVLDLPTDYPRPRRQDFGGDDCRFTMDARLMQRVDAFCKAQGVSFFMLMLALLQLHLGRWSGQTAFGVGVPVAGRNRIETESLIGFFVNTLVMRGDLAGNPSFVELLARVRETALDAYANQDLPFDRLVEELNPARDPGRNPLVDVLLNVLQHEREYDFGGLRASLLMRDDVFAKFAMTLFVRVDGSETELRLVYQSALFAHETMQCFLRQFVALLEQVLDDPKRTLVEYSLVTPADSALLPDPRAPIAGAALPSVVARFLRRAAVAPEHAALISERGTQSYRELADNARSLARWLQRTGSRAGDVIAVSGEAGGGVVVAILAVLLAGGIVMPLDHRLPALRKRLMLEQAGAARLLLAGDAEDPHAGPEFAADVPWQLLDAHSGLPASLGTAGGEALCFEEPQPDAPAYIFFTSGSTGVPKAVLGCHKGLDHFIDWQIGQFGITPADRVAQLTSLSFDVLLRDVFLPLAAGATLCIPTVEESSSPVNWLERARITVLHVVPTRANSWLDDVPDGVGLEHLRWLFLAGEPLSRALLDKWRRAFPRSGRIVNLYGPTETTLVKSFYEVPAHPRELVMPAGTPLPGAQLLILRDGWQLCGIGERGEIAIRTPYRTLGYRNSPGEMQARFVRSPFTDDARDIVYLTGDCGMYRADGSVMMLGRLDDQVKIRGVRVEPAEVAAVLAGIPGVAACHVGVLADARGDAMLAAWVVASGAQPPDAAELKAALATRLPSALVPSAYAFLDALPRLPNGKIDRASLPAPAVTHESAYLAPEGEIEPQLAAVWAELLGVARVGAGDDFFLLGGHSLLATRLVMRVHRRFGVDLPLRSVFEHPTLAGLARVIGRLDKLPETDGDVVPQPDPSVRRYPLASTQRRLWFLANLEPGGAAYHMRQVWRLRGELDARALAAALNHVVGRHEALRTAIVVTDDVPMQAVSSGLHVPVHTHDLRRTGEAQRDELDRRLREEHMEAFDLARPPLLRANLYCLAPDEHLLSLTLHHLVTDGWSTGLINRELSHFYACEIGHTLPALAGPAARFGDYALRQQRQLDERYLGAEIAWWRKYLGGSPALELASDRPRPPAQTGRGGTCERRLPARLGRDLEAFCRRRGSTLFTGLLAAFNALVYRYTGQQDFVIGTPIAGRNRLVDESVVGFYANTLLLRNRVSGQSSFAGLMDAARDNVLDAFEHQAMPFEKLVEALAPARDRSRNPLFQVMFSLQNAPAHALVLSGVAVEPVRLANETARFDLSFSIVEDSEGFGLHLSYSADLFDADTMSRMSVHFERLLEEALNHPDRPVATLPMLHDDEVATIVEAWNDTDREYGPPRAVHQLFEARVACAPEAPALRWGAQTLSYAQLNERANRLAHALIARGVVPETLVGICLERSPAMVVAMLAVLKAGGAYVPLDPSFPPERLAYMLGDSKVRIVIGTALPGASRSGLAELSVLDPEGLEAGELAGLPATNPERVVLPSHLAYVIYTSGSTGRPKGVMIEHGSVEGFVRAIPDYLGVEELAIVLASSSINFDGAVLELFGTLAIGGCLVLVRDILQLSEPRVRCAGITMVHGLPSALRELLALGAIPDSVKAICSGGEPLSAALADTLLEQTRTARLLDVYGPTEDTVYSTVGERVRGAAATVGRPTANARAYILDAEGNPVPVGVPGELYLSGRGLARGYLDRPELTAERFVEIDPGGTGRRRSYRTGDRARYLPDGRIVLLGRLDHQVKVRGHRIEIGEIESALERHPRVRTALVTPRVDVSGDVDLIAYIECGEGVVAVEAVREHLASWLPAYMVPARIEVLTRFPLLPNGKVDRSRLPEPAEPAGPDGDVPPETATECELAAIWSELLGVANVGRRSNFFQLGGHSLMAMRMIGRLESRLGVGIPVASVFERPTLGELALCIDLHGVAGVVHAAGKAMEIDEI